MSEARAEILARVRQALGDVPTAERAQDVPVERGYRTREAGSDRATRLERFCATVAEYDARVHRVSARELGGTLSRLCKELELSRVVVPPELPAGWRPEGPELIEDRGLSAADLDAVDGVLTGCARAIAQTGTIVLDGGSRSGRRAISLIPDHHLCVVEADQVVDLVPEAIADAGEAVRARGAPITLVSGPSATSDIELSRVEGVHGPRGLHVLLLEEAAAG